MSGIHKAILMILGALSALFLISQLVMGQLILNGRATLIKAHQHSGYTTVAVTLIYVVASLLAIAAVPTRPRA